VISSWVGIPAPDQSRFLIQTANKLAPTFGLCLLDYVLTTIPQCPAYRSENGFEMLHGLISMASH
jgi:hypothetical protein